MSNETPTDHQQWVRAATQEHEASLLRYAFHLTGDSERARDCVQETFLRLVKAERKQVDGHLGPWLFRVCRTRALDMRRKEGRMSELSEVQLATTAAEGRTPAREVEMNESTAVVLKLMMELPEAQQEVIRLRFQSGLSYKEIAEVTERTVSHVGVLIHKALHALREKLTSESDLLGPNRNSPAKKISQR